MTRRTGSAVASFLIMINLVVLVSSDDLRAAGINTNVALPVREGGFVYRTQVRFLSASDDPSPLDRDVERFIVPHVLVYGASRNSTLFGVLPYIVERKEGAGAGQREEQNRSGFADMTFLLRQTVYTRDAVQQTSRFGLLGGVQIPSGRDEFSSHAADFLLGSVYTLQSGRHELDADLLYQINTVGRGIDPGEELAYDVAYQLRLAPWDWPERGTPSQLYGVLELNGLSAEKARADDDVLDDTGGTVIFLSPGLQWVSVRLIYEVSVQVPIAENRNGDQLKTDLVAAAGIRVQF